MARPILIGGLGLVLIRLFLPTSALGAPDIRSASIFVGPAAGAFTVGSTFTVSVFLNTGGNSINAVEANLTFPPDKLQVVTPSTGKSLIQMWISQPTYSNTKGTLKFQGAIPTPGINTESGLISTITFRVKQTGVAALKVIDTSRVLLNDGKGTDILGDTTSGIYELILPPPAGPLVTSPTNPDQDKWHQSQNVIFQWEKKPGTQGFSYVLNDVPVDIPDDISEGVKTSINYKDLEDGIHYFHIKSLRAGSWGGVTHFGVNIDNTPPAGFEVDISPSDYTSQRKPIVTFETTDRHSGIDHYELKFIPLDPAPEEGPVFGGAQGTPFFVEAIAPYLQELPLGRYDVVVRAYDKAGNYYQAEKRLTIAKPIFEFVRGQGLRFGDAFTLGWLWVWILGAILLALLGFFGKKAWVWHREIERHLEAGAHRHPQVVEKAQALKEKLKEYGRDFGHSHGLFGWVLAIVLGGSVLTGASFVFAQNKEQPINVPVEPPVVTLFPESISNDEIFYIGGRAGAPEAEVIIYLQQIDTGQAVTRSVKTDATGAWFYSMPKFLDSGNYAVWTQFKVGEALSPPSSKLDLEVAPTAIQFGESRLSYERLYLILFLFLLGGLLILLVFLGYHFYHHKAKSQRLLREIKEAEESIRRGFLVIRRDIDQELMVLRKAKLSRELRAEEQKHEEKLLKDLEAIKNYIGEEVWDIEQAL